MLNQENLRFIEQIVTFFMLTICCLERTHEVRGSICRLSSFATLSMSLIY